MYTNGLRRKYTVISQRVRPSQRRLPGVDGKREERK